MGAYDHLPYEVGKGKPPRQHQWKAGQSGNPKGRKPRSKPGYANLGELLARFMDEMTEVTINGKKRSVTKAELLIMQTIHDAGSGTATHRLKALKQLHDLGAFGHLAEAQPRQHQPSDVSIREVVEELAEEARCLGLYDDEQRG